MIIQLHPDKAGHWTWYEKFEKRVRDFGDRSGYPVSLPLITEMRQRFVNSPRLAGYFIEGQCRAHLLSWVLIHYGKWGILIYQGEGDNPGDIRALQHEFFEQKLPEWIEDIKQLTKGQYQPEFIELNVAPERVESWERMLPLKVVSRQMQLRMEPKVSNRSAEDPLDRMLKV
jgi:hypothetical protein